MSDPFSTLEGTLDQVWLRLARGVAEKRAPARHPVLATMGPEGAEVRTMVLRYARRSIDRVELNSDLRSAKVDELRANPQGTLLIWEPRAKLQIRLRTRFEILEGDKVRGYWRAMPDPARLLYGGKPAPGMPIGHPAEHKPVPDQAAYCVLRGTVVEIDTLQLGMPRHRRALFRAVDGWVGKWSAP
ncbi:pyridoxamine 5'-phosphate oxidase [Rhodovulum iodosum]|uniref:Pyridoxamine 5'-phosphate oxidase n=1 Tax=Rhodovulum iodosum TaxID=68291 RepID=A0ABV3XS25_9RHOB|nr:pyridoxamine 5'-phosphate oxidase family protein [Rhodovulum robiginosum]RSK30465.1 pyridoxamine 5'-phosphate oxidase [Rhodovulum robiginosum]